MTFLLSPRISLHNKQIIVQKPIPKARFQFNKVMIRIINVLNIYDDANSLVIFQKNLKIYLFWGISLWYTKCMTTHDVAWTSETTLYKILHDGYNTYNQQKCSMTLAVLSDNTLYKPKRVYWRRKAMVKLE